MYMGKPEESNGIENNCRLTKQQGYKFVCVVHTCLKAMKDRMFIYNTSICITLEGLWKGILGAQQSEVLVALFLPVS